MQFIKLWIKIIAITDTFASMRKTSTASPFNKLPMVNPSGIAILYMFYQIHEFETESVREFLFDHKLSSVTLIYHAVM